MTEALRKALSEPKWINHKIGNLYTLKQRDGGEDFGWKIAYYPLFGTYKNGRYVEFGEPRALIEKPIKKGTDFREVHLRYLTCQS
jgi:hypothetical protein